MVRELVDEEVFRPGAVDCRRRVDVVEPAAAVGGAVHQDRDELVGGPGGDVAKGPVLIGEDVALGPEDVVGRPDRRAPPDVGRGPGHARLGGRGADAPHVEVAPPLAERLAGEQRIGHARGVGHELGVALRGGVAVPEQQQVDGPLGVGVPFHRRSAPGAAVPRGSRRGPSDRPGCATPRRTPAWRRGGTPRRPPAPPVPGSGTTRGRCDRRSRPRRS